LGYGDSDENTVINSNSKTASFSDVDPCTTMISLMAVAYIGTFQDADGDGVSDAFGVCDALISYTKSEFL
jgi:hypothetical protein